jgi:hypothetical protein
MRFKTCEGISKSISVDGNTACLYVNNVDEEVALDRSEHSFRKSRSHLKILRLGATVQDLIARATWHRGFVHPCACTSVILTSRVTCRRQVNTKLWFKRGFYLSLLLVITPGLPISVNVLRSSIMSNK